MRRRVRPAVRWGGTAEDDPGPPVERLDWRPQRARQTAVAPTIRDPIVEPQWAGRHVLAHFDAAPAVAGEDASLVLIDEHGADATEAEAAVTAELRRAVTAFDAIIDGYLTPQATRTGEGSSAVLSANAPTGVSFLVGRAESWNVDVAPVEEGEPEHVVAFVAVDLLRLDGQSLLDVPLLERKRLLEAVILPSHLVRVTPYSRPPVEHWLSSWKSMGFEGAVLKAANSRYRPASVTEESTVVTKPGRR